MKHLTALFLSLLLLAFAPPASAQTCTTHPIATGTIGAQSQWIPNPNYIRNWSVASPYSFSIFNNFGSAVISFGAGSGAVIRTGTACTSAMWEVTSGTGDCTNGYVPAPATWGNPTANRITSALFHNDADGIIRVLLNGVKRFEIVGLYAIGSLSSTSQTWTDGVSRIRQDTGSNSRFYFEGYNTVGGVTSWKSVAIRFSNSCGSVP